MTEDSKIEEQVKRIKETIDHIFKSAVEKGQEALLKEDVAEIKKHQKKLSEISRQLDDEENFEQTDKELSDVFYNLVYVGHQKTGEKLFDGGQEKEVERALQLQFSQRKERVGIAQQKQKAPQNMTKEAHKTSMQIKEQISKLDKLMASIDYVFQASVAQHHEELSRDEIDRIVKLQETLQGETQKIIKNSLFRQDHLSAISQPLIEKAYAMSSDAIYTGCRGEARELRVVENENYLQTIFIQRKKELGGWVRRLSAGLRDRKDSGIKNRFEVDTAEIIFSQRLQMIFAPLELAVRKRENFFIVEVKIEKEAQKIAAFLFVAHKLLSKNEPEQCEVYKTIFKNYKVKVPIHLVAAINGHEKPEALRELLSEQQAAGSSPILVEPILKASAVIGTHFRKPSQILEGDCDASAHLPTSLGPS